MNWASAVLAFRPVPLPTTRHAAAVTPSVAQNLRSTPPVMDSSGRSVRGQHVRSTSALFYRQGTLVLEDGTRLRGVPLATRSPSRASSSSPPEWSGYPESLTDPSYRGQLLVMTYPIVGNYGVPIDAEDEFGLPMFFESPKVQVAALIVADYSHHHSHWNSQRSLSQWLTQQKVPALYGIDTRLLTKKIREKGALKAYIEFEDAVSLLSRL